MTHKNHHNGSAVSSSAGEAIMLLCSSSTENTVIHSITAHVYITYTFLALAWKQLLRVYTYRHMGVKALFSSAP